MAYGLPHMILDKDPDLRHHLTRMVTDVAVKLDQNQMIRFDSVNAFMHATDLGRIASNFYIKYETIEMLNETGLPVSLSAFMPDDMVIALISMATEFSQLKVSSFLKFLHLTIVCSLPRMPFYLYLCFMLVFSEDSLCFHISCQRNGL
ncbi:unnamed protein product [Heligmosomoides polygyrus]|uniref:SEC63 domain-containing protein n=1 Tax=Heligmosomoides polygyrus TaxID=6339 RepID=A0A183GX95_HELPZ|nr:unnamed protein product [Heligmosomoides polygyrus]